MTPAHRHSVLLAWVLLFTVAMLGLLSCQCHSLSSVLPPTLQSAVYLAGGKRASSGDSGHLHTPARRLARTIICLGPQEGLAFGLQAIRAIEATAGAGSGDLHR